MNFSFNRFTLKSIDFSSQRVQFLLFRNNKKQAMKQVCVNLQANNLNQKLIKIETRLKDQEDIQRSLHTREGVKRFCKYLEKPG